MMRIGIDISQLAYKGGVANYLENLIDSLVEIDKKNEYVFFFSGLRSSFQFSVFNFQSNPKITVKTFRLPPSLLDLLWNKLHVLPIEWLIGPIDLFITSDWTEPPTKKAKKATIIYDLTVYKTPKETAQKIIDVQKRKLEWVKKESSLILAISESTKNDIKEILGVEGSKIKVIYPGL